MATISTAWTENQTITFDATQPQQRTVEGKGVVDIAAAGYEAILVQVKIIFGGSADGNAEIRTRGSADSGTTKDTLLLSAVTIPFTISATKVISLLIERTPYIEIGVYNGNSAVEDITISAKYAGLKYSSA